MLKLNSSPARSANPVPSPASDDGQRAGPSAACRSLLARLIIGLASMGVSGLASAEPIDRGSDASYRERMTRSQVDAAIALGNLDALGRIDKASRLESLYTAMIETEQARIKLRQSIARRDANSPRHASPVIDPLTAGDDASGGRIRVTAFREDGPHQAGGTAQIATLLRPNRYAPLVVTLPHALTPDGRSASPALESVVVDESLASQQTFATSADPSGQARDTERLGRRESETARSTDSPEEASFSAFLSDTPPVALASPRSQRTPLAATLPAATLPAATLPAATLPAAAPMVVSAPIDPNPEPDDSIPAPVRPDSIPPDPVFAPAAPTAVAPAAPAAVATAVPTEPVPTEPAPVRSSVAAAPPAAAAADAEVAAQWPFAMGGRETLPTPQNTDDVTLSVDDVDVRTVLEMLAKGYGMNILVAPDVVGSVTANVSGLTPEQTLTSVARMCGLAIQRDDNVILIYPKDNLPRESRELRVFPLDFARAEVVEPTITGLLSPIGSAYSSKADDLDNRKGRESIVVVDTPDVLEQVERYLMQADQAPLQVMIEARVMEIELKDNMEHGVNFEAIFGGDFRVGGFRLTDNIATSTNPFYFGEISGSDLKALLTVLETTTDAKTLATPRVMVVNGQNAKIQVGQQLGFAVATVTQTSTIQDVRYLDTGVVLNVTPTISRDHRILLQVKPKVSSGEINPDTLLPEETTREVETSVMLDNHQGMIVGGLIQEEDRVVIKKLPWLGDVRHVGKFFQRRETSRARTEIIVALIPHIIDPCQGGHYSDDDPMRKQIEWERTENHLFNGPLNRECRPWEARLPDVTADDALHREIDRLRNRHPYCKGCEPIKTSLLPNH
ncbi:Type IV pilus biogenesis and competence protein PilQ precursor [Stieleria neptunia]|uniref:Type IV pilus biogenesis and competence protein PilQ n=1 Tax=Stieleria neptunia TaxID=2527979 RepID=A0A518HLL5_9BACT|nr:hypothetical protein [Stieleria neptunia]QDV41737.1 Type IV pilus biogenesis and competence protein PilQ precursor [Stieleria neptunia]